MFNWFIFKAWVITLCPILLISAWLCKYRTCCKSPRKGVKLQFASGCFCLLTPAKAKPLPRLISSEQCITAEEWFLLVPVTGQLFKRGNRSLQPLSSADKARLETKDFERRKWNLMTHTRFNELPSVKQLSIHTYSKGISFASLLNCALP